MKNTAHDFYLECTSSVMAILWGLWNTGRGSTIGETGKGLVSVLYHNQPLRIWHCVCTFSEFTALKTLQCAIQGTNYLAHWEKTIWIVLWSRYGFEEVYAFSPIDQVRFFSITKEQPSVLVLRKWWINARKLKIDGKSKKKHIQRM